jgi:hypothetical protein
MLMLMLMLMLTLLLPLLLPLMLLLTRQAVRRHCGGPHGRLWHAHQLGVLGRDRGGYTLQGVLCCAAGKTCELANGVAAWLMVRLRFILMHLCGAFVRRTGRTCLTWGLVASGWVHPPAVFKVTSTSGTSAPLSPTRCWSLVRAGPVV